MATLTYGTVTGRFEDTVPGVTEPITGTVSFKAEADYLLSPDSIVLPAPVVAEVVNGEFSVDLVATDEPSLNPVDWTYRVVFALKVNSYPVKRESFSIKVPGETTTDISTVTPVPSSEGKAILAGPKGADGTNGADGAQGIQGIQGIAGAPGAKGDPAPFLNPSWSIKAPKVGAKAVFDTGSGWSVIWASGTNGYDSVVKKQGTGSIKMTLATDAAATQYQKTFTAVDMSATTVRFWLRSTDWANVASAQIRLYSGSAFFFISVKDIYAITHFKDNEWVEIQLPRSVFSVNGAPVWTNISKISLVAWSVNGSTPTVWFNHVMAHPDGSSGVVSITFDDSWLTAYTEGARIMDNYGYAGTMYSIPSVLGQANRMTQEQTDDLHSRGWDISGHGADNLSLLSDSALEADVKSTAVWLNTYGYRGSAHYSYPNGANDERIRAAVRKYFASGRSINACAQPLGYVSEHQINAISVWRDYSLTTLNAQIDAAITNKEWLIINFHNIRAVAADAGTDFSIANFTAVMDKLKASGVRVENVSNVLQ